MATQSSSVYAETLSDLGFALKDIDMDKVQRIIATAALAMNLPVPDVRRNMRNRRMMFFYNTGTTLVFDEIGGIWIVEGKVDVSWLGFTRTRRPLRYLNVLRGDIATLAETQLQ